MSWSDSVIRELISLVRANSLLFDKRNKLFRDTRAKSLTWETLGRTLSVPCSGEEAAKKFKSLRDTFGKEHRKALDSAPRSGAGGDVRQVSSQWEFYHDLLFVAEHLTSRRTQTNMKRESEGERDFLVKRPPPTSFQTLDTPSWSSVLESSNTDSGMSVCELVLSPDCEVESITASIGDQSTSESTYITPQSGRASTSTLSAASSSESHVSVIREKASSCLKVPFADYKQKRKDTNNDDRDLVQSLDKLTDAAVTAMSKIDHTTHSSPSTSTSDPYSEMICCALKRVPEDKKLICLSDILKIMDIYSRGKTPVFTETDL